MKTLIHLTLLLALLLPRLSATDVTLTWQDNAPNETGYLVQRAVGAAGTWFNLADNLPPDTELWLDQVTLPGTTYQYRVRCFNQYGSSAWSNTVSLTLPPAGTPPLGPGATLSVALVVPGRLVNLSARAPVLVADDILIGGFVVENAPCTILLRAVGPGLTAHGVPSVLADPRLQIVGGAGNDNWTGAAVAAAAVTAGAFPLTVGSKDAALVVTLPPGTYTVHVTGAAGQTGNVLLEIYLLSSP